MNIEIKGFIIPHNGEPYYTCADRYAVEPCTKAMAIADGVGGSLYPSFLSDRITTDFVKNPTNLFDNKSLSLTKDYSSELDIYYQHRYSELSAVKQQILDLKAEQTNASSCTFVGCYIENNRLRYYTLGDSYLFFIAKDGTMGKYSSMDGKEFDVYPEYFSTDGKHNGKMKSGDFPIQDGILLMMTDALSDWFIKYYEEDKSLLNRLLSLNNHREYKEFCNNELALGRLHDDDCALLIAEISNTDKQKVLFSIKHMDNIADLSDKELQEVVQIKEAEIKEIKSKFNALAQEKDRIQSKLEETEEKLAEEQSRNEEQNENRKITEDSYHQVNNSVGKPTIGNSFIELGEIKKMVDILQRIEGGICQDKADKSLQNILQTLLEMKEGIDSLMQHISKKDESKKKLIQLHDYVKRNFNLLLGAVIIISLIVFFFVY